MQEMIQLNRKSIFNRLLPWSVLSNQVLQGVCSQETDIQHSPIKKPKTDKSIIQFSLHGGGGGGGDSTIFPAYSLTNVYTTPKHCRTEHVQVKLTRKSMKST